MHKALQMIIQRVKFRNTLGDALIREARGSNWSNCVCLFRKYMMGIMLSCRNFYKWWQKETNKIYIHFIFTSIGLIQFFVKLINICLSLKLSMCLQFVNERWSPFAGCNKTEDKGTRVHPQSFLRYTCCYNSTYG